MENSISAGIWPTMLTPFTAGGKIDEKAVERLVNWYIDCGAAGIFAVCQSSEMFQLSLAERTALAEKTAELSAGRVQVVASGHISDDLPDQIQELKALSKTGVDAVVLVSNRLAAQNEPDEVWIENCGRVLEAIPDAEFGVYECPYPYKRLLSEKVIRWCARSGRIFFIKDTCCDAKRIAQRLEWIKGTKLRLFNANAPTLLQTLRNGASGFCGILANICPKLLVWLFENYRTSPEKAELLQAYLTVLSWVETQQYPSCAKYYLDSIGVPMESVCRVNGRAPLRPYFRDEIDMLRLLNEKAENFFLRNES